MNTRNVFQALGQEELYLTSGGYEEDYEFGYKIGAAAKEIYNAACDVYEDVADWVSNLF